MVPPLVICCTVSPWTGGGFGCCSGRKLRRLWLCSLRLDFSAYRRLATKHQTWLFLNAPLFLIKMNPARSSLCTNQINMAMINNCHIAPNTNISSRGNTSNVFLLSNTWTVCQGFEQTTVIATTKHIYCFCARIMRDSCFPLFQQVRVYRQRVERRLILNVGIKSNRGGEEDWAYKFI